MINLINKKSMVQWKNQIKVRLHLQTVINLSHILVFFKYKHKTRLLKSSSIITLSSLYSLAQAWFAWVTWFARHVDAYDSFQFEFQPTTFLLFESFSNGRTRVSNLLDESDFPWPCSNVRELGLLLLCFKSCGNSNKSLI